MILLAMPGCTARVGRDPQVPGSPAEDGVGSEGEVVVVAGSPTAEWMALRERIDEARENGTLTAERCTAWADELVALHLHHGEPYVGARLESAALLRSCGQHGAAQARLTEALEAMPRWARAEALDTLGVLAHESGDDGAAIAHLHAALHADPALLEARNNLVRILMRIYEAGGSDFARDDILRQLDSWRELAPDDPRVDVLKARFEVIRARREPAAAEAAQREAKLALALVLRGDGPQEVKAEAFVLVGQLRLDQGDDTTALRAFKYALELDPTQASASLLAATVLLRTRGFEEARHLLEAADATVDPTEERTRLRLLAVALRGLGRFDDAAEVYERLLSAEPPEPLDLYNRAQLELYRLDREPAPHGKQIERVRDRFGEVIAATQGHAEHAELERRARAEQRTLEELLYDLSHPDVRHLDAEAAALAKREREEEAKERPRLLELERRARAAHERETR